MDIGTISITKWFGIVLLAFLGSTNGDQDLAASRQANVRTPQVLAAAQGVQAPSAHETGDTSKSNVVSGEKSVANASRGNMSYRLVPRMKMDELQKYSAVEVVATGYYAGKESTGKTPGHPEYGITYSGLKVKRDETAFSTIAADPRVFPIGTVLYVPGYGYGIVADTGGAIKGKKIDLYFDTKDQVFKEWGKRTVTVFVVKKGQGKMTEVLWNQLQDEILSPRAI